MANGSTITVVPVVTAAGAQPTDPSVIRATLVTLITADVPGYTDFLPASMVEDLLSTSIAGIAQIDAAFVDLINSIAPTTANPFITNQLGQTLGIPQGLGSNASVNLTFTGPPGYVIQRGFTVADGTGHQYIIQDGGVIATGGTSGPLYAVSPVFGIWPVLANSVQTLVTQAPSGITLSVTNPLAGTVAVSPQSLEDYRAQILKAERASAQGMQSYLKSLLTNPNVCPGVDPRLVAVQQNTTAGGWEIIVGGGDPYQVAYAINDAIFDVSTLKGSSVSAGRNQSVNLSFYPDTYTILFVLPVQQTVQIQATWNTDSPNFVSPGAVAAAAQPALSAYINTIPVTAPINLLELQNVFQTAVASVLDIQFLSRLVFTVSINGVATPPAAGTAIITGDPEGYFYCTPQNVTVSQG